AEDAAVAECARPELAAALVPAEHVAVGQELCRLAAHAVARTVEDLLRDQQRIADAGDLVIAVDLAEVGLLHNEAARLLLHREVAVIGAADGDAVVAGRRLNPHIVETALAHDAAIGDAIERDTARHHQVLGAGRLAQPARAL